MNEKAIETAETKEPEYDTFTDPRDGKQYKTVKIGEQAWLAKNLNWEGAGVWYNNSHLFGNTFGRLYTWEEALIVAPPGWHLPTDEEWQRLTDFTGGIEVAGEKLKSKDGWDGNGTNAFGFSALPGGCRNDGTFKGVGVAGFWWSTTEENGKDAYGRGMCDNAIYVRDRNAANKYHSYSIRLVKD